MVLREIATGPAQSLKTRFGADTFGHHRQRHVVREFDCRTYDHLIVRIVDQL